MFTQKLRSLWKRPQESLADEYKQKLIDMRAQPVMTRIDKPTRLDRARSLGYKAKKGHVVIRVRIEKGKRKTPQKGRRCGHAREGE